MKVLNVATNQNAAETIVRHLVGDCSREDVRSHASKLVESKRLIRKHFSNHKYEEGQAFTPTIKVIHGKTSPPDPLTECQLISLTIERQIGKISTYASHIANVLKMGYASLVKENKIVPTKVGLGLFTAKTLKVDMIWPSYRRLLEEDIAAICNGTKDMEAVFSEHLTKYRKVMTKLLKCRVLWDYSYENFETIAPSDYK